MIRRIFKEVSILTYMKWNKVIYDKYGNVKGSVELSYEGLNKFCYFCGFDECKPHIHHIIRKTDGGDNSKENLLPLCPNHHALVHKGICIIGYNPKEKIYLLDNIETNKITYPTEIQKEFKRNLPKCIIKNPNLIISGDINTKAEIKIKKKTKEVCNEKGVQTN